MHRDSLGAWQFFHSCCPTPTYPPPVSADSVAHTRFPPCALLETTMAIPAWEAKRHELSVPPRLSWAEKKGRPSAATRRRRSLGPSSLIWFRPERPYQHAPCFLSLAVNERIEVGRGPQTSSRSVGKIALPPS
jgi:hypothetical protein